MIEETRLFDINSIELNELFDSARIELKSKNDDYKKLKKQYYEIMDRFPSLQLIFEDDEVFELNKEECKMLQKVIQLGLKINEFVFPHKFKINVDTPIPILNYIKKRGGIIERIDVMSDEIREKLITAR